MDMSSPDLTASIALATLGFFIISAITSYAARKLSQIDTRLHSIDDKVDASVLAINNRVDSLYSEHERRDQERHVENVERLTRLETLALNGHATSRKARGPA